MKSGSTSEILEVLRSGTLEIESLLPWSSNYTFMVRAYQGGLELPAVYKPIQGERPLWDFPLGTLSAREYAAFLVSDVLGWDLIPPTVLRQGEHGLGTVQLFIEHDPNQHYFTFEGQPAFRNSLQRLVLLDVIINNADRKGSHVLIDDNDHIWLIDHGISFHHDEKLRTVIWDFAGEPIPEELCSSMINLEAQLNPGSDFLSQLENHLNSQEIDALAERTRGLLSTMQFPNPQPNRRPYPWPPV